MKPKHRCVRHLALCCDYDGTLAHHGHMDEPTRQALERVAASGRQLLLVTGRELEDLGRVLDGISLFARVVAENGALLYTPSTGEEKRLAAAPPEAFVRELRARAVQPLSVGRSIVATWEPNERVVMEVIHELGLELHVIFNKGAVMVLPSGVNKASGLAAALQDMGLSPHNAVGIGDAENDHAFLKLCEVSAAVANALPSVKEGVDIVTRGDHGAGVIELADELLRDDLASRVAQAGRHRIEIGASESGEMQGIDPQDAVMLITGRSGSGKSTVAKGLLERLVEQQYSFCVVDPEGDYVGLPFAVTLGAEDQAVTVDAAMQVLDARNNAVLNLLGMALHDRPAFLASLMPRLAQSRAHTGQPHWLVIDEAHHMLDAGLRSSRQTIGAGLERAVLLTVHPDLIAREALRDVNALVVVGPGAADGLRQFAKLTGREIDAPAGPGDLEPGCALTWLRNSGPTAQRVAVVPSRSQHRRHNRKYAEGELPEDRCFYFRGAHGKLKLRAQNLMVFLQMADGVDDETWLHHLRQGDYSAWFAHGIKDEALAAAAREIECAADLDPAQTRAQMRSAIERLYTAPD